MSVFFTGQALQIAGTGTRKRRIKLKPFFSMHVVIYTVAVAVKINKQQQNKQTNKKRKYTGIIRDVQISTVQQRISKTKNYGGKVRGGGGGGRRKKIRKKCFPGEIAGLATQKLISNITFGFTVIFTFIHSKCSMQASNFSFGRGWGRRKEGVRDGGRRQTSLAFSIANEVCMTTIGSIQKLDRSNDVSNTVQSTKSNLTNLISLI